MLGFLSVDCTCFFMNSSIQYPDCCMNLVILCMTYVSMFYFINCCFVSEPVHIIIFIHAISAFITQLTISYGVNHRVNDLTALKQVYIFFLHLKPHEYPSKCQIGILMCMNIEGKWKLKRMQKWCDKSH